MRRRHLALLVIGSFVLSVVAWQPLNHRATAEVVEATQSCRAGGSSITTGPDGNIWFGQSEDKEIGRLTLPSGPLDERAIAVPPERADDLVVGSDGNIWTVAGQWVSVIRPDLSTDTFQLPSASGSSVENGGAVEAPDGNVYVLRLDGTDAEFVRITPSRTATELVLPIGSVDGVGELTVGTDGAAWFFVRLSSEPGTYRLFRAPFDATSATQVVAEQQFVPVSGPLLVGTDIWYVRQTQPTAALVRVNAGGVAAEVPTGHVNAIPDAPVTVGPDGRIWMLGPTSMYALGTDGSRMVPTLPHAGSGSELLQAITAGSDGHMWYTTTTHLRSIATNGTPMSAFEIPSTRGAPIACFVTPNSGSIYGGETVTLQGRGLSRVTNVYFDGAPRPFTILSDFAVRTTTPASASGDHLFTVRGTPAQTYPTEATFRSIGPPVVSSACPANGSKDGGYWIMLRGQDLDTTYKVRFGDVFTWTVEQHVIQGGIVDRNSVRVFVPARRGGNVRLSAYNQYGTGHGGATFLYTPLPVSVGIGCNAL